MSSLSLLIPQFPEGIICWDVVTNECRLTEPLSIVSVNSASCAKLFVLFLRNELVTDRRMQQRQSSNIFVSNDILSCSGKVSSCSSAMRTMNAFASSALMLSLGHCSPIKLDKRIMALLNQALKTLNSRSLHNSVISVSPLYLM